MDCTDEEIELLVSWFRAYYHDGREDMTREAIERAIRRELHHGNHPGIISAAGLMREARRRGAEEMREHIATGFDGWRNDIATTVRKTALPGDPNGPL